MITCPPDHVAPGNVAQGWATSDEVREYYRTLLGCLPWGGSGSCSTLRTLGITSCARGEGVTTVAAHLAVTAACAGNHQVLLVDSNLARPSAHRTFGLNPGPGFAEAVLEGGRLPAVIQASPVANLSILAAGQPDGDPAPAYDSPALPAVVEALRPDFDLIVFDMPAVQGSPVNRLAGLLDGVLLVVEAERVRWEVSRRGKEQLARANARLLGAVLVKRRHHLPRWLYRVL